MTTRNRYTLATFAALTTLLALNFCSPGQEAETGGPANTPDWAISATIYEVNLRQYTPEGTFEAFAEHLPRLHDMGVDILWLMPIHPIGVKERKGTMGSYYSVYDYFDVNPKFGTKEDFRDLVTRIHDHDMYIILDWVANHTSWDAVWTRSHPHLYTRDNEGNFIIPPGTDWTDVIQLDFSNPETHEMMHQALEYWVREFHIDGYRCDVAEMVPTPFWNEARRRLDAIKPVFMLAEAETPEHHDQAFEMSYAWETHHRMNELATGRITLERFVGDFEENRARFPDHAFRMQFTSNHDENSWNGTVFERLGEGAEAFAVLSATLPGMPLVYSGQEAAMDKRLEFFEKDPIDWAGYPLLEFYTRLLQLNRTNRALFNGIHGGDFNRISTSADDQVLAFSRQRNDDKVVVVLNLSPDTVAFELDTGGLYGKYQSLFGGDPHSWDEPYIKTFDPWQYKVYHRED